MRLVAIVAAVTLAAAVMAMPLGARTAAHRLSSSDKTSVGPTEALQQLLQQGGTPQTGYCLKCLPPHYEWPKGGAGPG
jgi:hypothetical protein